MKIFANTIHPIHVAMLKPTNLITHNSAYRMVVRVFVSGRTNQKGSKFKKHSVAASAIAIITDINTPTMTHSSILEFPLEPKTFPNVSGTP
jgi:hypothetical protein